MAMVNSHWLFLAWPLALLLACEQPQPPRPLPVQSALHNSLYVFDLHIDSIYAAWAFNNDFGKLNDSPRGWMPWIPQADLPRLEMGGVDAMQFGLVVTPFDANPTATIEAQLDFAEREVFGRFPERIVLARSVADFERAYAQGKIAAWLSLEGAHTLGDDLNRLEAWVERGVRSITMAHFTSNKFAASNADPHAERPGLSDLGRRLVCQANRLGVVLDVAHTHPVSLTQTIELSRAPVIVSHTGIYSLVPTFRNLLPEHISLIRDKGGVIGILFATNWISTDGDADLNDILDQIDAVRYSGGIETLAIGSDYDGVVEVPIEVGDVSKLPVLTEALKARGYSDSDLAAIWGQNILRVFRDVEAVALELQATGVTCP